MTSFSRCAFDISFSYMPYVKSRFKKDSLLILIYSELLWYNSEPEWVKGYIFAPSKNKTLKHRSKSKHNLCYLWQQLTHSACMVLSIASIILLAMRHYSSPMQDENEQFNLLSRHWP